MSIVMHVTLQKIVAHDFRYDPRSLPVLLQQSSVTLTYRDFSHSKLNRFRFPLLRPFRRIQMRGPAKRFRNSENREHCQKQSTYSQITV